MDETKPSGETGAYFLILGARVWVLASLSGVLSLMTTGVHGQTLTEAVAPRRSITLVPRLSVSETFTDNVRAGDAGQQSDRIMEISPGLVMTGDGDRLKGYLDYSLNKIQYANNTSSDKLQKSLNAFGTLEAIENFMSIDVSGSISQQSISALGTRSAVDALLNANQTEVSNYLISPSIKGRIADVASYEARWSRAMIGSQSSLRSGVGQTDIRLKLSGDTAVKGLAWSAGSSRQTVGFSDGRPTEADRHFLGIAYALTPQISLNANTGVEANNYSSLEKVHSKNSGWGVDWHPSDRTALSGSLEQRPFGSTHRLNLEHRTGRTAWKVSDTKSTTTTPGQTAIGSIGSIYDILFTQFSTLEPNELARAQLVNAYLQVNKLSPNTRVLTPFLASAQTLTRQQDVIFALLGARSTVTFMATQTRSKRLDSLSSATDDFSTAASIQQKGISINYSHRLSPSMRMSALGSWQKSSADSSNTGESTSLFSINLARSLAKNSTIFTGFRRVIYRGLSEPSKESALTFNLNLSF